MITKGVFTMYKILVCDDEIKIRETFRDYLCAKGFDITLAENGEVAVRKTRENNFDLIILDVMMPVMNGLEACKIIRKTTDTPILFLSALGEEQDILDGFRNGCDDYITKPFPMSVLTQKCNVMITRYRGNSLQNEISLYGIKLDKSARQITVNNNFIELSNKTFQLLQLLMENNGTVLTREQILTKIWGWDFDGDERVVDTHIKKLRKALGEKSIHIKTVIGGGYSFREG